MKTTCISLFLLVYSLSVFAQHTKLDTSFGPDSIYGKNLLTAQLTQLKIDKYHSMAKIGNTVFIVGIPVVAIGGGLMIKGAVIKSNNNDWSDESIDMWIKGDNMFISGCIVGSVGVASIITGAIFKSIGKRKSQEYIYKRNSLRITPYTSLNSTGINLLYRF